MPVNVTWKGTGRVSDLKECDGEDDASRHVEIGLEQLDDGGHTAAGVDDLTRLAFLEEGSLTSILIPIFRRVT